MKTYVHARTCTKVDSSIIQNSLKLEIVQMSTNYWHSLMMEYNLIIKRHKLLIHANNMEEPQNHYALFL